MPFKPGHPQYLGDNPNGKKRAMKNLALSIREGVHPDEIRDWLVSVWQGRDPLTGAPVELKNRAAALQMLLDRGWGQAAQHMVVEGNLRNELIAQQPASARPKMTIEQINTRRQQLRDAGIKPRIIDAEAVPAQLKDANAEDE